MAEETDPRAPLRRVGIADAHGCLALAAGGVALLSALACCLVPYHDDDLVVLHVGILVAALWTGAFGVVTRGTDAGRHSAMIGLGMAVLAVLLGMLALCHFNPY